MLGPTPAPLPATPLLQDVRRRLDVGIAAGSADAASLSGARSVGEVERELLARITPDVPARSELEAEAARMRDELRFRTPADDAAAMWQSRNGIRDVWAAYVDRWKGELAPGQADAAVRLLQDVARATADVTTAAKARFESPRPYDVDPQLPRLHHGGLSHMRSTDPVEFGYPSGHTSLAVAAATVLGTLLPAHKDELMEEARQVAFSRVYGVMHFPADVQAGARLGSAVATWMLAHSSLAAAAAAPTTA
jgi:membrane-associated phospholipid phosphatase